jgi:hypothetical protein
MKSAKSEGRRTSEFQALVGGSMAVIVAFIVGKLWPTSGVSVDEQELVLGITGMVSAYMTVRGWTKASYIKVAGKDEKDDD